MEFFEFFFSGPGWGWKVFALICFTSVVFDGISRIINAFLNHNRDKYTYKEIIDKVLNRNKTDSNNDSEGTPATKDDVR